MPMWQWHAFVGLKRFDGIVWHKQGSLLAQKADSQLATISCTRPTDLNSLT